MIDPRSRRWSRIAAHVARDYVNRFRILRDEFRAAAATRFEIPLAGKSVVVVGCDGRALRLRPLRLFTALDVMRAMKWTPVRALAAHLHGVPDEVQKPLVDHEAEKAERLVRIVAAGSLDAEVDGLNVFSLLSETSLTLLVKAMAAADQRHITDAEAERFICSPANPRFTGRLLRQLLTLAFPRTN